MSAKDDASRTFGLRPHHVLSIALAIVAGAAVGSVGALLVTPADRPFFESRVAWTGRAPEVRALATPLAAGESVTLERSDAGTVLVARAARAPRTHALAESLVARRSESLRALFAARDTLASHWGAALPAPPTMTLAPSAGGRVIAPEPAARCASLLAARARQRRDVATAVPSPWDVAPAATPPVPSDPLYDRMHAVAVAVDSANDSALGVALVDEARAEDEWFAAGVPSASAGERDRAAAWQAWQRARADSLDAMAARLAATLAPAQVTLAQRGTDRAVLDLALRLPRPYDALVRSLRPAWAPVAMPIAGAWLRWAGTGALVGAAIAAFLALVVLGFAMRRAPRAEMFVAARDPGAADAWLHVVAGPTGTATSRAILEVAAHALARGQRVLVVDGSTRLKLHERFGREARWGLMECLLADMPVIGLVQYGGRPGFYLLAHGNASRSSGWAALGQRLDDARPHFGRIILAIDGSVPRELGESLLGRSLEGWWAEAARRLPKAAVELTERLGIAFSGMDLSAVPQVSLETLSGRARALALLHPEPAEPLAELPTPMVEAEPVAVPAEPLVLDCDLQMRQRLRFLAWMRRVQSERRRAESAAESAVETVLQ